MRRSPYTPEEIQFLKSNYRSRGAPWCARSLGRTAASIRDKAVAIGIGQKRQTIPTECIRQAIERLHPLGYTDQDICRALVNETGRNVHADRVGHLRRRMGLSTNVDSERHRQKLRSAAKNALTKNDVDSLSQLRWQRWRQWKRQRGLPEDLTNLAAVALDQFLNLGPGVPISRVTLCHLLGVDPKRKNAPLSNTKGGTVLSELYARGLIGRLKHALEIPHPVGRAHGRPVKVDLYYLAHGVRRNEQHDVTDQSGTDVGVGGRPHSLADETASGLHQLDIA